MHGIARSFLSVRCVLSWADHPTKQKRSCRDRVEKSYEGQHLSSLLHVSRIPDISLFWYISKGCRICTSEKDLADPRTWSCPKTNEGTQPDTIIFGRWLLQSRIYSEHQTLATLPPIVQSLGRSKCCDQHLTVPFPSQIIGLGTIVKPCKPDVLGRWSNRIGVSIHSLRSINEWFKKPS